jgi:hypothetical protein
MVLIFKSFRDKGAQTMLKNLGFALLALALATTAPAQVTTGEILGVVQDTSGAVVPNAQVTVKNLDTNATREVVAGADGRYRFPALPVGRYEVQVVKQGFATFRQGPIVLMLNQSATVDVKLQVSGVSEVITVASDALLINTTNATVGVNFDQKRISELPLSPTQNILSLALSVAGVSQLSSGNSAFASGGVNFSVNGNRLRSNNFMIDGSDSNNPSTTGLIQEINNPDTVAEFRLITNQFLPEFGRAAGSVVNIITKSGTNDLHGSLYWLYNGNKLNSRSNLDKRTFAKAPWRVQNQFGGTAGGPVIRDKTFFFGSLLRWTDHLFASGTAITGAPTAAGQELLRSIASTRPQVQALLTHLPAAQTPSGQVINVTADGRSLAIPVGTLSGAAPNTLDDWQASGRVDHRFTEKHSAGGRYLYDTRESVSGQAVPPGLTGQNPARRQATAAFLNSSLSPSLYNELRANYQRWTTRTFAADARSETIPSIEITELGLTGFNAAASRTAIGLAVNFPQGAVYNTYQLNNTLGWIRGSHAMKFGFDFRRIEQATEFNPTLRGRLQYTSLQNLINDVAQVAAINTLQPGVPRIQPYKYYDYFFFVQDEWRVMPRMTFTYGLRYETPGNAADTLVKLNQPILAANNNNPAYLFEGPKRDKNNWAPRFGLNYRFQRAPGPFGLLTGDGKMVMRLGYSRTYDTAFNNIHLNVFSAFPFTIVTTRPAASANGFATIDPIRAGTVIPTVANPNLVTRTSIGTDFRSPYSEQFAVNVQRELATDWAFTLGWVATKGTALFQTVDGNPMVPGTGGTLRVNPNRGIIRLRCNCAASIYHSLQTSLEKRLSRNFSMGAHYTWSAYIDDASEIFNPSVAGEVAVSQDSFNRAADRGRSTYDRPHRLSVNGVFEVPYMREQRGVAGKVLGGWEISGFLNFQSGPPFSPLNGADPGFRLSGIDTLVGNAIRPHLNTSLDLSSMTLPAIIAAGGRTLFSQVTAASPIGNAGRNILRADGINNLDLGINKNIRVSESNRLQVRAQFYNLTNSRDYGIPQANVNNAGFGLEGNTDGGNRRIILGLRYVF